MLVWENFFVCLFVCECTLQMNNVKGIKLAGIWHSEKEKKSQGKAPCITGWIITSNKTQGNSRESTDENGKKNWLTKTSYVLGDNAKGFSENYDKARWATAIK